MAHIRLGVDIGGTFTDFVLWDRERGVLRIGKVLSTPEEPSRAVLEGTTELLARHGSRPAAVEQVVHGTTLVANAIIERKGVPTGLITTKGFRDVLEAGREVRYETYDLFMEKPAPLVPRRRRLEVTERVRADGSVLTPLDEPEARAAVTKLVEQGVESVAVCFLNSYVNPAHEQAMGDVIREVAPALDVTLSSSLTPELREYERTSTAVANAYVRPLARHYLKELDEEFRRLGMGGRFFVMLSNGGVTTADVAADFPVRLIESGPVGGVLAAAYYGRLVGLDRLVALDMGGTTTKVCLLEGGQPLYANEFEVARLSRFKRGSGLPVRVRSVEMLEVGAGGGSIARADALGVLKVGPTSAGAQPGPACYGRGGTEPTVTDADLYLGYLNPDYFLGGEMPLDQGAAEGALARVAKDLGLDPLRVAVGVHELVNDSMAIATRTHMVERGRDPRGYALVMFGGAGPVHAYGVARRLKLRRVVCPLGAGVTSAFGFLVAPRMADLVRSLVVRLDGADWGEVNRLLSELESEGRALVRHTGADPAGITVARYADMRYAGQAYEVTVPLPDGPLSAEAVPRLQETFYGAYRELFSHHLTDVPVEAITWRVVVTSPAEPVALRFATEGAARGDALKGSRRVYFAELEGFVDCPVYDRYALEPGSAIEGPAIVEERESTAVVGPRARATVDRHYNLVMEVEA